jgi:hypothetical protein
MVTDSFEMLSYNSKIDAYTENNLDENILPLLH